MFFQNFQILCVFPVWNYFSQFSLFSLCSGNPVSVRGMSVPGELGLHFYSRDWSNNASIPVVWEILCKICISTTKNSYTISKKSGLTLSFTMLLNIKIISLVVQPTGLIFCTVFHSCVLPLGQYGITSYFQAV